MPVSLNESSAALTDKLVSFLWSQWSTLGLAGYANSETPCITDPEALLLLSTSIARQDSRLFDEVLDWMRENESWLNLQRLRHLMKEYPYGEPTILGAMAERGPPRKIPIPSGSSSSGTFPSPWTRSRNPCSFLPDSSVSRNPCSCAGVG